MKTNLLFLSLLAILGLSANAQTMKLWGTATSGGVNGSGTIFMADADGSNLHTVYSFINATGEYPVGGVVLADNGKLYGVTYLGGFDDSCVCYSYDPRTGIYTDIHNLYQYIDEGWEAWGGMIKAEDGMLYGLCAAGGTYGYGSIYRINPANDTYTDIHNFNLSTDGGESYGSLIQAHDGKLYGMTMGGGTHSNGTIFNFDPVTSTYSTLYSFDNTNGGDPYYGRLTEATDGKLYGMTYGGGIAGVGVIFSFDRATSSYAKLHDFNTTTGASPYGSLLRATDGNLYGLTSAGGSYSNGVLFSFDPVTNAYTDLINFNGTNGSTPHRSLTQGSTGKLYGSTFSGGTYSMGVEFSYDIATATYTKLVDFNSSTTGTNPDCEIVELPSFTETGYSTLNETNALSIFPNPALNSITISNKNQEETLHFFDLMGQELALVKTSPNSKTTVNILNFPTVFFVKTQTGEIEKIVRR